jgi:hypothetical protein
VAAWLVEAAVLPLEELPPQPARATAKTTTAPASPALAVRPALILMGLVATAAS